jgi:hypothetical protein
MQTFSCRCGNPLFFENTHCLACESEVGWCPACSNIVALEPLENGGYQCSHEGCSTALMKCHNYAVENVCNRMVVMAEGHADTLCDCCRYNDVIPDLDIEGNRERWAALEGAKRRLFHTLDLLKLPHGIEGENIRVPLMRFLTRAFGAPRQNKKRYIPAMPMGISPSTLKKPMTLSVNAYGST